VVDVFCFAQPHPELALLLVVVFVLSSRQLESATCWLSPLVLATMLMWFTQLSQHSNNSVLKKMFSVCVAKFYANPNPQQKL
jgi:hypothetical protein